MDKGETARHVLGLVGLDVPDAVPFDVEIGDGVLLGKGFLHVILAKNPLPEPEGGADGLHGMELRYGDEAHFFRLASGDAGGLGDAFAHGFQTFPKRCCF